MATGCIDRFLQGACLPPLLKPLAVFLYLPLFLAGDGLLSGRFLLGPGSPAEGCRRIWGTCPDEDCSSEGEEYTLGYVHFSMEFGRWMLRVK